MTNPDIQPFDAAQDLRDAPRGPAGVRMRPRDAATLILVRGGPDAPEVLMGRRASGHVFMASKWVFPGGKIDRSDFTAGWASPPAPDSLTRLATEMPVRRARALCLTAVRETWEETGLMLARSAPPVSVSGPWRGFRQAGALPDLAALTYVARAVTPPGRTRRFDARFFMADASALLTPEPTAGSGELDEIAWLPLDQAAAQDLPAITRFVLGEVAERHRTPDRAPPYVRFRHGRHIVTRD
jgi:8-oxo-dGTP pyrophosphatase MutT (NUDIX family)